MGKIGWIGLRLNTFRLGNLNVGKMPNMRECVKEITTVNFGGIFVMGEGEALLITLVMVIAFTLVLNAVIQVFI